MIYKDEIIKRMDKIEKLNPLQQTMILNYAQLIEIINFLPRKYIEELFPNLKKQ